METLMRDLRFGLRMIVGQPGFALVAVIALALGIGANTAVFSVVNAVLLKPLPYRQPERLIVLFHNYRATNFRASVSVPGFLDYRGQKDVFEDLAAIISWSANLSGQDEPERVQGRLTSATYFRILGIRPTPGRDFTDEEDIPGKNHVVLISNGIWKRRFGSDESVIGRKLVINGEAYTIIGVLPPDLWLPEAGEIFSPIAFRPDQQAPPQRRNEYLSVIGRLKDGVTSDQAKQRIAAYSDQLRAKYYSQNGGNWAIGMEPWNEVIVREIRPALILLQIGVFFVLLIACANVASLLTARSTFRRKEIALRTAIGAGRSRLVRQFLTESVLLSLMGGICATVLALGAVRALQAMDRTSGVTEVQPGGIPRVQEVAIDMRVLGFALLVSLTTGAVFGLAPALQLSGGSVAETLKESGRGGGISRRTRFIGDALVVVEFGLALMLLIGAGLLIRSFVRVEHVQTGFRAANVLTARVSPPVSKYPFAQLPNLLTRLVAELAAQPAVVAVGAINVLPLSGQNNQASFDVEGLIVPPGQPEPHGDYWVITPDYFRAMGIPLLQGRTFSEHDGPDSPRVVIVDETLASRYFSRENPIGRHIGYGNPTQWREIVGVVAHVKNYGLDGTDKFEVYLPHTQSPDRQMFLVVRGSNLPSDSVIRSALRNIDPDLPAFGVQAMTDVVANSLAGRRFSTTLLGIFAGIALALSAVGIYGVIAYSVAQRTHEFGIRLALGAAAVDVLGLVVRQGLILSAFGIAIGLTGAFGLTRLMSGLLFQVSPTDGPTYVGIAALLVVVSLTASYIPARRATRVDPVEALRAE
jgi:putative ABC transport system permease protein